jgi:transcriptional regulator with XRE-family HTH domain
MARPCKNSADHPELSSFGNAVRQLRQAQGVSQEALADLAGVDRSYMGGVERGEHNLALVNIKKIADALKLSVSEVMGKAGL